MTDKVKAALINDLKDIIFIISFNRDMFKENYDRDIIEMIKDVMKKIINEKETI